MIPVESLNDLQKVVLMTSTKEQFEITPKEESYNVRDITPPMDEMTASVIHSIKAVKGKIEVAQPEEIIFFDGIAKGFRFA